MEKDIKKLSEVELLSALTEQQKRTIYENMKMQYVREDVADRIEETDILEKALYDEQDIEKVINDVVTAYVCAGEQDSNLTYWQNIDNLLEKYKGDPLEILFSRMDRAIDTAKDAVSEIVYYLESHYDIEENVDYQYEEVEDQLTWVYALDESRVRKVIERALEKKKGEDNSNV